MFAAPRSFVTTGNPVFIASISEATTLLR